MASPDDALKSEAATTKAEGPRGTPARKSERPSVAPRPGGPESLIGMTLSGRYRIERLLGEGGMGAVYQAEHTHMRKRLAIKVLHPEMSRLTEVVARFEREAMAAANIDHPNVAKATDFGKLDDGSFFLALEFVEGHSLREAIGKGRLELGRVLHIMSQIAGALGRAHQLGIVHRDLKPENVMLVDRDGDPDFVKVLDFGIAKVPVGALGSGNDVGGASHPVLTQLGMVYGTPEYMAPEQALGQEVDARADLYALGIIAYEMLTGERPFDHESKVALLGMHVTAPVPPFSERAPDARIPREVEAIIVRLLAKEATHRFADARELVDAISAIEGQLVAHGIIQGTGIAMPPMSGASLGATSGPMSSPMSGARAPLGSGLLNAEASSSYPKIGANLQSADPFRPPSISRVGSGAGGLSRRLLIGGAAAIVFFLLVGVGIVIGVSASNNSANGGVTSASASTSAPSPSATASISAESPMAQVPIDAEIAAARANVDKGNYASAIDSLVPLEERFPQRADIHQLLEKAYSGAKNTSAAMREAGLWIDTDPAATDDLKLLEDVRNAALTGKDGSDVAFAILEEKLGATGTDILYDVGWLSSGQLYPAAAAKARASLAKPSVRAIASKALQVLLDFRDARTCDAKRALLDRARDDADARMVAQLKLYTPTTGCGFLKRHDCFPCLHRDRALVDAIGAINARAAQK